MSSCGPQASAIISPNGFRVRMMERKKTSPQIAIKNHRVKVWTTGIMMSTGQDFSPKPHPPCLPSASQIKEVFLSMDFFLLFPQESCPKRRVDHTPRATCAHRAKTIPFVCYKYYCCWGIAQTSPFMPGSSQTSTISSNFCGYVNVTIHGGYETHPVKSSSADGLDPHKVNSERKGSKNVESTFLEVTFLWNRY